MPNITNIIASHNNNILSKEAQTQPNPPHSPSYNCRHKESCPLDGKCITDRVVYQATVKREDNSKVETYMCITEGTFKSRYNNHTNSFRNPKHHIYIYIHIYMMKVCSRAFISAPQRESNPCLPIAGTVVLPLNYRVSDRLRYIYMYKDELKVNTAKCYT